MDLDAWIEAGRLRHLLQVIQQMPRSARWREARRNDPEYVLEAAERLLDDDPDEEYHPPGTEWTAINEQANLGLVLLGVIASALGAEDMQTASSFPAPFDAVRALLARVEARTDDQLFAQALTQLGFQSTTETAAPSHDATIQQLLGGGA